MVLAPEISVLLPVYNGERYIAETIESVLTQTFSNFELIIINDGSTDNSLALLESYAKKDNRCRLYNRANKGLVETSNELVSLASCEIIAWLDHDDVCMPNRLQKQFDYLNNHPECVAVGSDVLFIDKDGRHVCEFFTSKSHAEIDAFNISGAGSCICNPSVSMRKSVLVALGGLRSEYVYAQDLDCYLRMAEIGEIAIIPEVLLHYRLHLGSASYALKQQQITSSQMAINAAKLRRGVPLLNQLELQQQKSYESNNAIYLKWAWWAFGAGNINTAYQYGLKAFFCNPFSWQAIKFLLVLFRAAIFKKMR